MASKLKILFILCYISRFRDVTCQDSDCKIVAQRGGASAVAEVCTNSQVSGENVVMDFYGSYERSEKTCDCAIKSTATSTYTLAMSPILDSLVAGCGSRVDLVTTNSGVTTLRCSPTGSMEIQPGDGINVTLVKEKEPSDSRYCMMLLPSPSNTLTVTCSDPATSDVTTQPMTSPTTTTSPATTTQPTTSPATTTQTTTSQTTTTQPTTSPTTTTSPATTTQPTTSPATTTQPTTSPATTTQPTTSPATTTQPTTSQTTTTTQEATTQTSSTTHSTKTPIASTETTETLEQTTQQQTTQQQTTQQQITQQQTTQQQITQQQITQQQTTQQQITQQQITQQQITQQQITQQQTTQQQTTKSIETTSSMMSTTSMDASDDQTTLTTPVPSVTPKTSTEEQDNQERLTIIIPVVAGVAGLILLAVGVSQCARNKGAPTKPKKFSPGGYMEENYLQSNIHSDGMVENVHYDSKVDLYNAEEDSNAMYNPVFIDDNVDDEFHHKLPEGYEEKMTSFISAEPETVSLTDGNSNTDLISPNGDTLPGNEYLYASVHKPSPAGAEENIAY